MYRLIITCALFSMVLAGCNTNQSAEPPAEQNTHQAEGMFEAGADEEQSNDDLLINSRYEAEGQEDKISTTRAENLVKEHLQINENSNTVVAYVSKTEDGHYLIRVNTVDDDTNQRQDTSNDGLYMVNAKTGEIQRKKQ
ncbi:hypothetical protein FZW96_10475 [Bacillus sp. BGMRC 2118]|nr:hypothetical protein FZW96_10475 [Bacillus sp. BGMRC 2118]